MEPHKIALEIDGQRFEAEQVLIIDTIQDLLIQAGILEDGDILQVLEGDHDYIFHKY